MMRLFSCANAVSSVEAQSRFVTPLGTLNVDVVCGSAPIQTQALTHALRLRDGSTVGVWRLEGVDVEVWCGHFVPTLPKRAGEVVDACAAIIRFAAATPAPGVLVTCGWNAGEPSRLCEGPQSGEGLDAQSWHDTHVKVMLGTEGGDALFARAETRRGFPARLVDPERSPLASSVGFQHRFLDLLDYEESRLVLRLPPLMENESYQVQFVCPGSRTRSPRGLPSNRMPRRFWAAGVRLRLASDDVTESRVASPTGTAGGWPLPVKGFSDLKDAA